mmetsp:Transcript_55842/g.173109  ORF Transcript_55842/g.173109 Transcript_55842/m.173109 type:complete len:117 (+) Transcript_55842:392-742(+)
MSPLATKDSSRFAGLRLPPSSNVPFQVPEGIALSMVATAFTEALDGTRDAMSPEVPRLTLREDSLEGRRLKLLDDSLEFLRVLPCGVSLPPSETLWPIRREGRPRLRGVVPSEPWS